MPQARTGPAFGRLLVCCLAPVWLLVAGGLAGCATAGTGDPALDAELKKFAVAPDRSGLFVYRSGQSPVSTPASVIQVDGKAVGLTSPMRYVYVDLPPGKHQVRTSGDGTVVLEFDARPGALTYVWEEVPTARAQHLGPRLHLVTEAVGKAGVLETTLAGEPFLLNDAAPLPAVQTLQVRVEADGTGEPAAMDCEASNDLGRWPFTAPGALTVRVSALPLQIVCRTPEGMAAEPAEMPSSAPSIRGDNVKKGMTAGAVAGTAVGVGLAVASIPVLGPLGALFVVGGAARGAEVGGLVGALAPEQPRAYPDAIVLKLKAVPSSPR